MKNIITLIFIAVVSTTNAQVLIGDTNNNSRIKTSILLEFDPNQNKGIILPYVRTLPTNPVEGTLLLDASNPAKVHIKYYNGEWMSLSGEENANIDDALANQPTFEDVVESNISKTIIGASRTTADGVLVLESSTKSLILPIVRDVQDIVNPSPGMIVYINKTGAKRLAVFNGNKWAYWKRP